MAVSCSSANAAIGPARYDNRYDNRPYKYPDEHAFANT